MNKSLYDILEVSPKASPATIKAAYRSLIGRVHPDKMGVEGVAPAQEINFAYEVLSDPVRRAAYDVQLAAGDVPPSPFAPPGDIIVTPSSSGAPMLGPALQSASPGARIRVRPGLYPESLRLTQPVEIIGDGPVAAIVIEAREGSCLELHATEATVRGLTLRSRATAGQEHAVWVPQGRLILEDCDVNSDSYSNIQVIGTGTELLMRRCRSHGGNQCGIVFRDGAGGVVEDSEISGNGAEFPGNVYLMEGAEPLFRRCRIVGGPRDGVYVSKAGGMFEDCEIAGHRGAGVTVFGAGAPVFRRCSIRDTEANDEVAGRGVVLREGAGGVFEECEISANGHAGVRIESQSHPSLRGCHIEGQDFGILAEEQSGGRVEGCHISVCAQSGIYLTGQSAPEFRSCTIGDSHVGVTISERSGGRFLECRIYGSSDRGVLVVEESDPEFQSCRIFGNAKFGVGNWAQARGTFSDCEIYANGQSGAGLESGAATVFRRCIMRQNGELGFYASNGAAGVVEACNLTGNRTGPILIHQSRTRQQGNRVDGSVSIAGGNTMVQWSPEDAVADPYLPGLEHERIYANVYYGDTATLIGLLENFAREHLRQWRKAEEAITPDGSRFSVRYERHEMKHWALKSGSVWGRIHAGLGAYRGGDILPVTGIPYELAAEFTLTADPAGRVDLFMRATEQIDPQRSVQDYPLGKMYLAPSALYEEGYFGYQLDRWLIQRLLPKK